MHFDTPSIYINHTDIFTNHTVVYKNQTYIYRFYPIIYKKKCTEYSFHTGNTIIQKFRTFA